MIYYLQRDQLDITKYDTCIKLSVNARIYAYSWYLDIVADNWDALVLNDYEAVMPLPWRQKYFIKYIYPPAWTQQLGVFSSTNVSEKLVLDFIRAIPKKFKKVTIQFNSENKFEHKNVTKRVNYILPLDKDYSEIYNGFNKNRKRDLKKAITRCNVNIKTISSNEFLDFYLSVPKNYVVTSHQIKGIKKLVNLQHKAIQIRGIYLADTLEASILFLIDTKRIINLVPVTTDFGKENGLTTLILNDMIKKSEDSTKTLDFEGSMVKGVADFYKSFGSELEYYNLLQIKFSF